MTLIESIGLLSHGLASGWNCGLIAMHAASRSRQTPSRPIDWSRKRFQLLRRPTQALLSRSKGLGKMSDLKKGGWKALRGTSKWHEGGCNRPSDFEKDPF